MGFILAGWGDVPAGWFHGNCIRHQLHFMQCRHGEWVRLGSTDCIQPDHVAHVKVWAMAAHTSTHSSIFSSPPLTHTPHTHPRHVAVRAHSVPLLVTVVHLFDPLISLHDQSIRHGTHDGGLASRATMTTNTFGSGSWTSGCTYRGWDGNTPPSTRLEHGSLTQSTRSQAHPH